MTSPSTQTLNNVAKFMERKAAKLDRTYSEVNPIPPFVEQRMKDLKSAAMTLRVEVIHMEDKEKEKKEEEKKS